MRTCKKQKKRKRKNEKQVSAFKCADNFNKNNSTASQKSAVRSVTHTRAIHIRIQAKALKQAKKHFRLIVSSLLPAKRAFGPLSHTRAHEILTVFSARTPLPEHKYLLRFLSLTLFSPPCASAAGVLLRRCRHGTFRSARCSLTRSITR